MDQPGKVANPARGQLNRENEYSPVPVRGEIVMVRAVAAVRMVATELHPGSKVDPHAATSARRQGTSCSSAPSGSVVSAARLATIPIPALRL